MLGPIDPTMAIVPGAIVMRISVNRIPEARSRNARLLCLVTREHPDKEE
jgi:hypothetical protein